MNAISSDPLTVVFEYLTPEERLGVRRVSRKWNQELAPGTLVFQALCLNETPVGRQIYPALRNRFRRVSLMIEVTRVREAISTGTFKGFSCLPLTPTTSRQAWKVAQLVAWLPTGPLHPALNGALQPLRERWLRLYTADMRAKTYGEVFPE